MTEPEIAQTPDTNPAASSAATTEADDGIGWLQAIGSGLAVLLVGFVGAVWGPSRILTKALGLTQDARKWLAVGLFVLTMIVLAWGLRKLQARGWI